MTTPSPSIYEVRRTNLARLLEHRGAKTALAIKLNVTQPHISHLLRSPEHRFARPIHEDTAREIERAIGLSPGELDRQRDDSVKPAPPTSGGLSPIRAPDATLLAQTVRSVIQQAGQADTPDKMQRIADLVTLAYKHNEQVGYCDEAYIITLGAVLR